MPKQRLDLTGRVFHRLTVAGPAPDQHDKTGKALTMWHCICSCGGYKPILGRSLVRGATKSCGCIFAEQSARRRAHNRPGGPGFPACDNPLDDFDTY
jgi:hypothetical protein